MEQGGNGPRYGIHSVELDVPIDKWHFSAETYDSVDASKYTDAFGWSDPGPNRILTDTEHGQYFVAGYGGGKDGYGPHTVWSRLVSRTAPGNWQGVRKVPGSFPASAEEVVHGPAFHVQVSGDIHMSVTVHGCCESGALEIYHEIEWYRDWRHDAAVALSLLNRSVKSAHLLDSGAGWMEHSTARYWLKDKDTGAVLKKRTSFDKGCEALRQYSNPVKRRMIQVPAKRNFEKTFQINISILHNHYGRGESLSYVSQTATFRCYEER
jgi:hypothetical protein